MTEPELKEEIIKAIKKVYDPEIPVDVWELGLIYDIKIFPVNNVFVEMTLTSPSPSRIAKRTFDMSSISR